MRTLFFYPEPIGPFPSAFQVEDRDIDYQSTLCIELGGRACAHLYDPGRKLLNRYPWWNREHADAITGTINDWIRDDGVRP